MTDAATILDSENTMYRQDVEAFDAFLRQPENADRRFELINGEIVEVMPAELHNLISGVLFVALWLFNEMHDLGRVTYETRYRARADDKDNDRLPDISFTRKARLLPVVERGPVPQIPDLCVEIQSPDDNQKDMHAKAAYYLDSGAEQVWLVFTKRKWVEVIYPDGSSDALHVGDVLTGGELLPGFEIAVEQIFSKI
jgi:Uma2 family endonuclease